MKKNKENFEKLLYTILNIFFMPIIIYLLWHHYFPQIPFEHVSHVQRTSKVQYYFCTHIHT